MSLLCVILLLGLHLAMSCYGKVWLISRDAEFSRILDVPMLAVYVDLVNMGFF